MSRGQRRGTTASIIAALRLKFNLKAKLPAPSKKWRKRSGHIRTQKFCSAKAPYELGKRWFNRISRNTEEALQKVLGESPKGMEIQYVLTRKLPEHLREAVRQAGYKVEDIMPPANPVIQRLLKGGM
mgnify:CR=1 FL=1